LRRPGGGAKVPATMPSTSPFERQHHHPAGVSNGCHVCDTKPISALNARRCLSAAVSFMIRERRRYFRHPVEIPATVPLAKRKTQGDGHQHQRGGMALFSAENYPRAASPPLRLSCRRRHSSGT
jgi:hypothetical protein